MSPYFDMSMSLIYQQLHYGLAQLVGGVAASLRAHVATMPAVPPSPAQADQSARPIRSGLLVH